MIPLTTMKTERQFVAQGTFTFIQYCDPQLGFGGYEHDVEMFKLAVKKINNLNPGLVLICGDLIDALGNENHFRDFLDIKGDIDAPCYCVPGNHDVGHGAADAELLGLYRRMIGDDYHSFDHEGYEFICVNTQLWKVPHGNGKERQDSWLLDRLKLAAKSNRPIFVVGHHPLFLNEINEDDDYSDDPGAPWWTHGRRLARTL